MNTKCSKVLQPKVKVHQWTTNIKAKRRDYDEKYEHENYQVFQHKNIIYNHDININDVDDHLEAVQKLKVADKEDYFMANGMDYTRCSEYINIVKYLNRCWHMTYMTQAQKQENGSYNNKQNVARWSIIGVIAFIYYYVQDNH